MNQWISKLSNFSKDNINKRPLYVDFIDNLVCGNNIEVYEFNSLLRVAHFAGQCAYETNGFRTMEEMSSGIEYNGKPSLGNMISNDGVKYRGRGYIMFTGRKNYTLHGKLLDVDLVNKPFLAENPDIAMRIACNYWKLNNINKWADEDDIVMVTKLVNGGDNGLEGRKKYFKMFYEGLR